MEGGSRGCVTMSTRTSTSRVTEEFVDGGGAADLANAVTTW